MSTRYLINIQLTVQESDNRYGPETYLRLEYSRYEDILQQDFSRTFPNDEKLEWNLKANVSLLNLLAVD